MELAEELNQISNIRVIDIRKQNMDKIQGTKKRQKHKNNQGKTGH